MSSVIPLTDQNYWLLISLDWKQLLQSIKHFEIFQVWNRGFFKNLISLAGFSPTVLGLTFVSGFKCQLSATGPLLNYKLSTEGKCILLAQQSFWLTPMKIKIWKHMFKQQCPMFWPSAVSFSYLFLTDIIQGRTGLLLIPRCLDKDPQFLPWLISGKHVLFFSSPLSPRI